MKPTHHETARSAPQPARSAFLALLLCVPLAGQQFDYKPAPVADPVKGMHDMSPLTPAEEAMLRERRAPQATGAIAERALDQPCTLPEGVLFDQPGDGRIWARGVTYKASFGSEGFVYIPFFGADAPRNYPVHFVLRALRIGGRAVPFAADVAAAKSEMRVTFARGAVHEIYDLAARHVEQTFVVDATLPGDLELELEVRSELVGAAQSAGVQFGNSLGQVHYGAAYVVAGTRKREIESTFVDGKIRMRVPATERGAGPVVIDPIIHTSAFTGSSTQIPAQPDIAYDATTDTYMVVWQNNYSATDTDIYSEFRRGDGSAISGSLASIDVTAINHAHPRVANLNAYDRFLVVMERFEAGRWQIWGRLRLANTAPHPIVFPISDPALTGTCLTPDVGGDSGNGDRWLVVWTRELSATDHDIHGRVVRADIGLPAPTIFIENSSSSIFREPQVSQSNGNGFTTTPRWLVAYSLRHSATDWDVYGTVLDETGAITRSNAAIDTASLSDLTPSVSSPATDFSGGAPIFMVTFERQGPFEARARLLNANLNNYISPVNLTQSFGLGAYWVRPESDGCRFAVISGAATITVATLAMGGGALVLHEAPQPLTGVPSFPRIASKRSGGGVRTDYGIAFVDEQPTPDRILVAAYRGHAAGSEITRRVMACGGLGIDATGRSFLGEELRFTLSNVGTDVFGQLLGLPAPAFPVCFGCALGLSFNGPLLNFSFNPLSLVLPCDSSLAGAKLAVQGYAIGSGSCLGALRFSDTIDFTIR